MSRKWMNYYLLNKMNFSKFRFNFSSDDDGTFWPGVVELPVEDNQQTDIEDNSVFNINPRVFTAFGLIILLSIFFTNKNSALILLIAAVFIASKEWFDMFDYGIIIPYPFLLFSAITPMLIVFYYDLSLIYISYFILPIGLIIYTGSFISYGIYEKFGSLFIFHSWFSLGITSIVFILKNNALMFTYFAIISISISDTLAYEIGRRYGKRKLIEHISPNKTVEGTIIAILFPTITNYSLLYFLNYQVDKSLLIFTLVLLSFGAILGDLFASLIKRNFHIKNASNLLPGHGGFLDRFDSVIGVTIIYTFLINFYALFAII